MSLVANMEPRFRELLKIIITTSEKFDRYTIKELNNGKEFKVILDDVVICEISCYRECLKGMKVTIDPDWYVKPELRARSFFVQENIDSVSLTYKLLKSLNKYADDYLKLVTEKKRIKEEKEARKKTHYEIITQSIKDKEHWSFDGTFLRFKDNIVKHNFYNGALKIKVHIGFKSIYMDIKEFENKFSEYF